MSNHNTSGFTLVELMFIVVIMGTMIAMGIPSMTGFRQSYDLRSASENVVGQLTLARQKAMAIDSTQEIHFALDYQSCDYYIQNGSVLHPKWDLPKGIIYYWGTGTQSTYRMTSDGRCLDSGMIVLQDPRGKRDTVSVLRSGLILTR